MSRTKTFNLDTHRSYDLHKNDYPPSISHKLHDSKYTSHRPEFPYELLGKIMPSTSKNIPTKYSRLDCLSPNRLVDSKYEIPRSNHKQYEGIYSKNMNNSQKKLLRDPTVGLPKKLTMNSRHSFQDSSKCDFEKSGVIATEDLYNSSVSQYWGNKNYKNLEGSRYRTQNDKSSENPSINSIYGSDAIEKETEFQEEFSSNYLKNDHLTKSYTYQTVNYKDLNERNFNKITATKRIKENNIIKHHIPKDKISFRNEKYLEYSRVDNCQTDRMSYETGFLKKSQKPMVRSRKQTKNFFEYEPYQIEKNSMKLIPSAEYLDDLKHDISILTTRHPSLYTPAQRKISIKQFEIGKCLGEGRFGKVYLGKHKQTGLLFALKKISKEMIKSSKLENQFALEVKIQMYLCHPNIVKLFGIVNEKEHIYLILEHMEGGSLYEHLKNKGKLLTEKQVAYIIKEMVSAIRCLHDLSIAHRDIKPENIMISNGVCKLGDFGWATICNERRRTNCGTLDYYAPQILEGQEYDESIDLWCVGVLTFQLLTGKVPFYHSSKKETVKKIIKVQKMDFPSKISQAARSFTESLLVKDPSKRMDVNKLLNHIFISKNCDDKN